MEFGKVPMYDTPAVSMDPNWLLLNDISCELNRLHRKYDIAETLWKRLDEATKFADYQQIVIANLRSKIEKYKEKELKCSSPRKKKA